MADKARATALERKRAYVAEQQRQLAAMLKNDEPVAKKIRVANASVTPPPWKRNPVGAAPVAWGKWQCACMIHPMGHATCNKCGCINPTKAPGPPPVANAAPKPKNVTFASGVLAPVPNPVVGVLPRPTTFANATPPKMMVVTIAETKDVTAPLDESLDDLSITTLIAGPDIVALWKNLDTPAAQEPKPSMQSIHHQIIMHESLLTKAQNETVVAETLSEYMQEAAQQQVKGILNKLETLRESVGNAPADK